MTKPSRVSTSILHPLEQPPQMESLRSIFQTRASNLKSWEMRAPTGQMSTVLPASWLSMGIPGNTSTTDRSPRSTIQSSLVPLPDQGAAAEFPAGFKISADKHPNRNGAEQIFGHQVFGEDASHLRSALNDGSIETIVAFCGGPGSDGPGQEWSAALAKASTRVLFSVQEGNWLDGATLVFPATAPLEKEGTWVSEDDRLQRTRSCWKPGEAPFPGELVLLQSLQSALGTRSRSLSAAGIFRELSEVCAPFAGHNHSDIGSSGLLLSDRPAGVGAGGGA